jgi:hypothetical protein
MAETIRELMNGLTRDSWRDQVGFSPEVQAAIDVTLKSKSDEDIKAALNGWVSSHQPCLFGRIAAKRSAITYCLIPEEMLYGDEKVLRDHIQRARLEWIRAGWEGKSSNFIKAVLSSRLAFASPSGGVKEIALRLCSLYLKEPIEPDKVYLDRLWLEQPGPQRAAWEWVAGVNYFSAQGDRRWWQDHHKDHRKGRTTAIRDTFTIRQLRVATLRVEGGHVG